MTPSAAKSSGTIIHELVERQKNLYEGPEIDARLERLIHDVPHPTFSSWDIHRLLRTSRALYFDSHVEVVSGHHTQTYLRFESLVRFPEFITTIANNMAEWIVQTFRHEPPAGIITTSSDARLLAERTSEVLAAHMPLRVVLTPFDARTGKIGTDIVRGTVESGERFISLNDVTTRGMCVSKLGQVVTDRGGQLAGMMVFARRDSGQFPLMDQLTTRYPFYFSVDLDMPQWEPSDCPLCKGPEPLLSWKDLPEL
ncbi:MAG: putative Orotate phosphoribosyltransferase (modular protein) [Nitrospira sp.]|jgi:orotate phosphoribosyltransferase|nr:putative Orotate phosphoribosyltransferase (modular protein) [Nitrospira sp.]